MPYRNRSITITIPASSELPFQADAHLSFAMVSGAVTIYGGSDNAMTPLAAATGMTLSGPVVDGVVQPIGQLVIRNESASKAASVTIITANGEIQRDALVGASAMVERTGVFMISGSTGWTAAAASIATATLYMEGNPTKRIGLTKWGLYNPGAIAAAATGYCNLFRAAGTPTGGTDFTSTYALRRNPEGATPAAILRGNSPSAAYGDALATIRVTVPTAMGPYVPTLIDLTDGGSKEPVWSERGKGFQVTMAAVTYASAANSPAFCMEWVEE